MAIAAMTRPATACARKSLPRMGRLEPTKPLSLALARLRLPSELATVPVLCSGIDNSCRSLRFSSMGEDQLSQCGVSVRVLLVGLIVGEEGGILRSVERAQRRKLVMVVRGCVRARCQPILRDDAARCVAEA